MTKQFDKVLIGFCDKNGEALKCGDKISVDYYNTSRPWWKDLEHKKEIDKSWEEGKRDIKKDVGTIVYRNGAFLIKFEFRSILIYEIHYTYIDECQCLNRYQENKEHHCGEYEAAFFDFEKVEG